MVKLRSIVKQTFRTYKFTFKLRSMPGPILKSKGMGVIFQKKGKEILKNSKIFENLGQNVQNLKIF